MSENIAILDIGAYSIKGGIANDFNNQNLFVTPTIIGFPKYNGKLTHDIWTKKSDIYQNDVSLA